MRNDKAKNTIKVLNEVIKNPLATQREIAEETGMGLGSVNRNLKELEQIGTKSDIILEICKTDINIVKLGQLEIERRLQDKEELKKMKTFEISQVIRENTARYSLFKGKATDNEGGLKEPAIIQIINPNEENNI